jgi:hypothetical protein
VKDHIAPVGNILSFRRYQWPGYVSIDAFALMARSLRATA